MKGVVLAGGSGSRLGRLTRVTNKHLIPVGDRPMIDWPIEALRQAGIADILVVTGVDHAGAVFQYLGSGSDRGVRFLYRVQDQAGGIAQALALAEGFVDGGAFCAVLGDNIFTADLTPHARRFAEFAGSPSWDARGMILVKRVDDPQRYGVAVWARSGAGGADFFLSDLVEKPASPPSSDAVTGIYFLAGSEVFEIIRGLRPSARGEWEVTDLLRAILAKGRLAWGRLEGAWTDAGTPESLRAAQAVVVG